MGQVSLDALIQSVNVCAPATDQEGRRICWAHATASVYHLASSRVKGRHDEFESIRADLLDCFGENDQNIEDVLRRTAPRYRLRYRMRDEAGARDAIHARRPVIATFWLDAPGWRKFVAFYRSKPDGVLTAQHMLAPADESTIQEGGEGDDQPGGHAVVLVRCSEISLTFMNSWGVGFGNNGFFRIDKASTLEVLDGPQMRFFDVYWTEADLSPEEKAAWEQHKAEEAARQVPEAWPQSFRDLPVRCPLCDRTVPAREYDGSWYEARCRACTGSFAPTALSLLKSLYNANYSPFV
jgi:hypothetical protein